MSKLLKILIVDDESSARKSIMAILQSRYSNFEIIGEAESVKSAIEFIHDQHPDLVLLDIDLTNGSGFDVLNLIKPINFKVIFITAHQEFAIKAIKFSALDYILKPVSSFELCAAVDRLIDERNFENDQIRFDAIIEHIQKTKEVEEKKIVLKTSDSIHLVNVADIIRCEADNNYTTFYLINGHKIIISRGLKEYDDLLAADGFFRVHQSHLINTKFISRFDKRDGGYVVLTEGNKIPVSQRKKQQLLDIFEKYNLR